LGTQTVVCVTNKASGHPALYSGVQLVDQYDNTHRQKHFSITGRATDDTGRIAVALGRFGEVFGRGLRAVLADDNGVRLLGEALDDAALLEFVANRAPQVVVLSEASAAERSLCVGLRAAQPRMGFVVLAQWPTPGYGARMLASGVAVCLSVDASVPQVQRAIRLAAAGRQALAPPSDRAMHVAQLAGIASLTTREREVLRLLSMGEANAAIALRLKISTETARTHVKSILRKLGASTRRELIGIAVPEHFW
jgi:DNA-binding NarL/FixJ family response regulator